MTAPTRVLLADDSPFLCRLLGMYLEQAGDFRVIGTALTGRAAIEQFRELVPDVVALDLMMPDLDGVQILREMMAVRRTPVVVITGASGMDAVLTLRALEAGASDFVMKFDPLSSRSPETVRTEIVEKLRRAARRAAGEDPNLPAAALAPARRPETLLPAVAVVGASTGGPQALRQMLATLPDSFAGAVVIVQHVPATFSARLAGDLGRFCRLPVAELREQERLRAGEVGIAPGGRHLVLESHRRVSFQRFNGEANCPSIDLAMESAAAVYGPNAVGVLLTGMGNDGAHGLSVIHQRGGKTMAQEPATCVVAGMPGAAIARGVAGFVGSPAAIGERLAALISAIAGAVHVC